MSKTIAKRVGRIISGSLNALINSLEDATPDIVVEQAIGEMDVLIDEVRTELGKVIAGKHLANKRLIEKNDSHESIAAKIDYAVSLDRDDLARAAIAHQLDIEAQLPILEQTIADACEKEKELERYLGALLAKKREMTEELTQFRNHEKSSDTTLKNNVDRKLGEVTAVFNYVLEKKQTVSSSAAYLDKLYELEKLARDNQINKRLNALKLIQKQ